MLMNNLPHQKTMRVLLQNVNSLNEQKIPALIDSLSRHNISLALLTEAFVGKKNDGNKDIRNHLSMVHSLSKKMGGKSSFRFSNSQERNHSILGWFCKGLPDHCMEFHVEIEGQMTLFCFKYFGYLFRFICLYRPNGMSPASVDNFYDKLSDLLGGDWDNTFTFILGDFNSTLCTVGRASRKESTHDFQFRDFVRRHQLVTLSDPTQFTFHRGKKSHSAIDHILMKRCSNSRISTLVQKLDVKISDHDGLILEITLKTDEWIEGHRPTTAKQIALQLEEFPSIDSVPSLIFLVKKTRSNSNLLSKDVSKTSNGMKRSKKFLREFKIRYLLKKRQC